DSSVNTIDFNLDVFAGAQQASTNAGETSLLINHGSPDAPMVDVVETTLPPSTLADNMSYPEFQGYVDVPTADYVLNVETADNATVVATYEAPLQTLGLGDQAISVLASGFLDPAANQNGAAFGLWVALPAGGPLVELPFVEPEPAAPAPDPTEDSEDVISMFSGVYTDVPVDTWLTSWSSAQLADIQIQGNDTKLYTDLDFAGAETVANPIDASGMDFFHIDVWSPNATTFRVKLVDLGATVEGELAFDIAQEQWVSLQIPLDDFADPNLVTDPNNLLTVRNSIQQVIISGLPAGAVTAYVDNVYFSTDDISTTQFNDDNFKFYPNPVVNTLNLNTSGVVENIKLYNVLGQEIMDVNPEVQSPQIEMGGLQSGAYMMRVTIDGVSQSFRVIKK
ncbi:MAG: T9SS type A sorting domain-containing protein, partial [Psychroflexus sp.]|nr:T9SS type A sorting domain-containing protein [Psychroflexus sp.]